MENESPDAQNTISPVSDMNVVSDTTVTIELIRRPTYERRKFTTVSYKVAASGSDIQDMQAKINDACNMMEQRYGANA